MSDHEEDKHIDSLVTKVMPEGQVFGGFQGIVCLIFINKKIAWYEPYRANRGDNSVRRRQIPVTRMYEL